VSSLGEAIACYHELLDDTTARETQEELDDQQRRRGLFFGNRPLCTVLRPRFLTHDQYRFLCQAMRGVLRALRKAHLAALSDRSIRDQLMLTPWEEELALLELGYPDPSPTSRVDSFFVSDAGTLQLVEYNAETPAAPAYNDALSEVFYSLPVMPRFERRYDVRPLPGRHHVAHALLEAYRAWGGRDRPRIAILDWREVPTYSEFLLFQEHFRAQGYECVIADPRDVEYVDGKLYAGGFHISLIYKRVLLSELVERCGQNGPVIRAVRERAACMVNPFAAKVLHKKASLALLSDVRNEHLFDAEDRRAIAANVPWTRRVEERRTVDPEGRSADLVPLLLERKDELVLKPNDEYGGKGVVLGWNTDATTWEAALQAALEEPWVVQRRVQVPAEPFPSMSDGTLRIGDRMLDTAPFICHGDYVSGCLTRISTDPLLNVTAGGGSTVPTFVIEPR
jgi:uncharacterized circularly permuted ATP-grasp superfamily protein